MSEDQSRSNASAEHCVSRPVGVLIIGILGIITGAWGTLVGVINIGGMLFSQPVAKDAAEWSYQSIGVILSASNLTASVGIMAGRRWARILLLLWCGFSIAYAGVYNGILSVRVFGIVVWTIIVVMVLRSGGASAFFSERSPPEQLPRGKGITR